MPGRDERETQRPIDGDHAERREDRAIDPQARPGVTDPEEGRGRQRGERRGRDDGGQPAVERRHRGIGGRVTAARLADPSPRTRPTLGLAAAAAAAVAAVAVALGAFSSDARGASATPGPSADAATVQAGEALYLQGCASCHGARGEGAAGPPIATAGAALVDFVLRTGRMPLSDPSQPSRRGTPVYDDAQTRAIVAYVSSLGTGPAIPSVVTSGANLATGRELYSANCAACHGATGAGGAVGGEFVAPNVYDVDPTIVGEAVVSGPGPMPVFAFPQDQLNDLVAYVETLNSPPHPGGLAVADVGPVAEGFLALFVALVTLLALARWIAREAPSKADEGAPPEAER